MLDGYTARSLWRAVEGECWCFTAAHEQQKGRAFHNGLLASIWGRRADRARLTRRPCGPWPSKQPNSTQLALPGKSRTVQASCGKSGLCHVLHTHCDGQHKLTWLAFGMPPRSEPPCVCAAYLTLMAVSCRALCVSKTQSCADLDLDICSDT